jgi:hypothetical protein
VRRVEELLSTRGGAGLDKTKTSLWLQLMKHVHLLLSVRDYLFLLQVFCSTSLAQLACTGKTTYLPAVTGCTCSCDAGAASIQDCYAAVASA